MSQAKTKRGNQLLQSLKAGQFEVKSISGEQYGAKRFAYIRLGDKDDRKVAESYLEQEGWKVNTDYSPGKPTMEVFLGYYNQKYDGFVEV